MEQGWEEMVSRWFCGWLHLSSLSDQDRVGSPFPCWGAVPPRAVSAPGSSEPSPLLLHAWLPSALSFQLALHSPLASAVYFCIFKFYFSISRVALVIQVFLRALSPCFAPHPVPTAHPLCAGQHGQLEKCS